MSDAQVLAKLVALESQIEANRQRTERKLDSIGCDLETVRSGTQLLVNTISGLSASIQAVKDLVTALQTTVSSIPTSDNTDTIDGMTGDVASIDSLVRNIDAQLAAFDPVIISDLSAQYEELADKIGDVPSNSSIWSYLQGVTNVDSGESDTVRTKVTGNVSSDDGSICNALVELLDCNDDNSVVGQTYTDDSGNWTLMADSGGKYVVNISVPGYNPFTTTINIPAGVTSYEVT